MPIHDWTRVDAGLFHDFHQGWTAALSNALNTGSLPPDFYTLIAENAHPRTPLLQRNEAEIYAGRANRLVVRHRHGDVVAVVEIISPGNKASRSEFRVFVDKSVELLRQGVHLLIVDLFPPGPRDPLGIHAAIWDNDESNREVPADKPFTLASYDAGPIQSAYVEFVAAGDELPNMPLFLEPEFYVPAPLEATYQSTWAAFPAALKPLLDAPASPNP